MRAFLLGLRIRIKLLAAFGSILLLSVVLIVLSGGAIEKIIYFKNVNEEVDMLKLRLQTTDRAHSLAQQEEEMRQNSEELQATQEEMERQRLHLQQEIKALKQKLNGTVLETW